MIKLYTTNSEGVWFGVITDKEEILATNFGFEGKRMLEGLKQSISGISEFKHAEKPSAFAERITRLMKEAYDGKTVPTEFILNMKRLPEHTRKVLYVASFIPVGYVSSYGEVAKAANSYPRAVGRAMATNPLAPIVPCHRVVGSDFSLVGYGGGLETKLKILKRECRGYTSEKEIPVDGRKLRVFPTEFVLKKVEKR
jgi:O-6-methylguanine DNA methyltransferase